MNPFKWLLTLYYEFRLGCLNDEYEYLAQNRDQIDVDVDAWLAELDEQCKYYEHKLDRLEGNY